jgi:hypothetical protein
VLGASAAGARRAQVLGQLKGLEQGAGDSGRLGLVEDAPDRHDGAGARDRLLG